MEITISAKNEYPLIIDIGNNLQLPKSEQFKVIIQKINSTIEAGEYASFTEEGDIRIDNDIRLKKHIVRFENPITLNIEGKKRPIEVNDILGNKFPQLFTITKQVGDYINELEERGVKDKKKY